MTSPFKKRESPIVPSKNRGMIWRKATNQRNPPSCTALAHLWRLIHLRSFILLGLSFQGVLHPSLHAALATGEGVCFGIVLFNLSRTWMRLKWWEKTERNISYILNDHLNDHWKLWNAMTSQPSTQFHLQIPNSLAFSNQLPEIRPG